MTDLVEKVLADDKAKEIVSLLLNNTLTVIPALRAATAPAREERAEFDEEEDEDDVGQPDFDRRDGDRRDGGRRGGRGDRREGRGGRGGRDRDNRGNRGGDRDDRGGRRHRDDSFGDDDDRQPSYLSDDEGQGGESRRGGRRGGHGDRERGDRGDRGDRGERGEGRRGRQREPRKPMMVDKNARLYVGAGSNQGVSKEALAEQVKNVCGLETSDVQRVSVRGSYSFVDVPEKVADQVVEKLGETQAAGSGEKLFVKRAVTLSIPRDPTPEELAAMQQQSDESYGGDEREGNGHRGYDEGHSDEEGPTLLAVDE